MKYSNEFKLECVRKYKEGIHIEDPPNTKHKQFYIQVRRWVRIFDSLGETGLEHGRPTLGIDQRLELIQRVENGETYTSVALSAGIQGGLLIKWHKIYIEKDIDGLQSIKKVNLEWIRRNPKRRRIPRRQKKSFLKNSNMSERRMNT